GGLIWIDLGVGDWSSIGIGYRTGLLRKTESPGDLDPVARVVRECRMFLMVISAILSQEAAITRRYPWAQRPTRATLAAIQPVLQSPIFRPQPRP
ncbi:MAG: hypothetical protein ACRENG_28135, partial [bacterium]